MRCHEARRLLTCATEPGEAVLDQLFGHVDGCPSCQEFDESRLPPSPLVALTSPTDGLFAAARRAEIDVPALLGGDGSLTDEPAPELLERAFARVDADPALARSLAPAPEALLALRAQSSSLAPRLSGLAERVSASLAPCFEARRALAARAEPSDAAIDACFAHLDACERCLPEDGHPALSAWTESYDKSALFAGFSDQVLARLPLRIGPRRSAAALSFRSARVQAVFALAAALLIALTAWKLSGVAVEKVGPEAPEGPSLAVEGQTFGEQFSNLRGFKPGIEWLENSDERQDSVERFSNEATLPGRDVEYSLPRSAPRGASSKPKPAKQPSLKQRLKREAKGPALSF